MKIIFLKMPSEAPRRRGGLLLNRKIASKLKASSPGDVVYAARGEGGHEVFVVTEKPQRLAAQEHEYGYLLPTGPFELSDFESAEVEELFRRHASEMKSSWAVRFVDFPFKPEEEDKQIIWEQASKAFRAN